MKKDIQNLKNEALAQIMDAQSVKELENLRVAYLGRQGKITKLTKELKNLRPKKRKEVGKLVNEAKNAIQKTLASQKNSLKEDARDWFDPTIPGKRQALGNLHLITHGIEEIKSIFEKIGFVRMRYPEVEWDWYAFEALNIPEDHPARDEWETFFIDKKSHSKLGQIVLTPHTSSGQIREMERVGEPPIRMVNIAKCYRRQSDATHFPMFHQFEGLVIDEGINVTHLKGTIDYFARQFYGESSVSRIRPYNFRFTEPSFEVDFICVHCKGKGCKFCKDGWHEVGGAGMVHPKVLENGDIDPKKYSGFAFGWGVERALLLKPGINIDDIRVLYSTDMNYLTQF